MRTRICLTQSPLLVCHPAGGRNVQSLPGKSCAVVVPFAAGGPTDALAGILCQRIVAPKGTSKERIAKLGRFGLVR